MAIKMCLGSVEGRKDPDKSSPSETRECAEYSFLCDILLSLGQILEISQCISLKKVMRKLNETQSMGYMAEFSIVSANS